jgi:hypothetical protein
VATQNGDYFMSIFKYLVVISYLLFHTSLCLAQESINLYVGPDFKSHCNQYGIDFSITKNSTIGILPAYNCADVNTYGSLNDQVTSTFNRILIPWRYSPHGAFKNGYFVLALLGMEKNDFESVAGSSVNVSFIDTGVLFGYQWFWRNGFNISGSIGVAHLMRNSLDQSISPTESNSVSDYLDKQTSTNNHVGGGVFLGWVF